MDRVSRGTAENPSASSRMPLSMETELIQLEEFVKKTLEERVQFETSRDHFAENQPLNIKEASTGPSDHKVCGMVATIPSWGVIVLEEDSVESLRRSYFEAKRKGALLQSIRFDSFEPTSTPESKTRIGVSIIQAASFAKEDSIVSLRPGRFGGRAAEKRISEEQRLDILMSIASKGFSWIEIEDDIESATMEGLVRTAKTSGTKPMLVSYVGPGKEWVPPVKEVIDQFQGFKAIIDMSTADSMQRMIRTWNSMKAALNGAMKIIEPVGSYADLFRQVLPVVLSDMVMIKSSEIDLTGPQVPCQKDLKRTWGMIGFLEGDWVKPWSLWEHSLGERTGIFLQLGGPGTVDSKIKSFNASFGSLGLDMVMLPWETPQNGLSNVLTMMKNLQIRGATLEMPLKTIALDRMDWVDPRAKQVGCIDTIVGKGGLLYGYDLELYSVSDLIKAHGMGAGGKALVFGTSASGRASSVGALMLGMEVQIAGSNPERAKSVAASVGQGAKGTSIKALRRSGLKFDVIINSVPLEKRGSVLVYPDDMPIADISRELSFKIGIDLNHSRSWTPFLSAVESIGGNPIHGRRVASRMMARSMELWTGKKPDEGLLRDVLEERTDD